MQHSLLKRVFVIGFIFIFIGMVLIPSLNSNIVKNNRIFNILDNKKSSSIIDWWPMYQHDTHNTGYSRSIAPSTNYTCWKYSSEGRIVWLSPSVLNGRLYFGTTYLPYIKTLDVFSILHKIKEISNGIVEGSFICLDAYTGKILWEFPTEWPILTPTVVDDRVYFNTVDLNESTEKTIGRIYCLNAETGDKIWNITIDTPPGQDCWLYSPTVVDGRLYISEPYGKLYCFNAKNGNYIWSVDIGYDENGQCSVTPAIVDGKVYIKFGQALSWGKIYCFDADNGDELWNYSIGRSEYESPAVINGKVFVNGVNWTAMDCTLYCFNSTSGEIIWNTTLYSSDNPIGWSSPAVCNDSIYLLCFYSLRCFDINSGNLKWSVGISDESSSSPSIADNKIYFGSHEKDMMYCRNAENGSLIWSYGLDGNIMSSPAIADGWIYAATESSIYAFRDNEPPDSPLIDGPTKCKPGIDYNYTFVTTDPEEDDVWYHLCWGDKEIIYIYGPYPSGKELKLSYNWTEKGTYTITCWARDIYDAVSDASTLEVKIPRTRASSYLWFHWFLDRFPMLERLLNLLR